MKIDKLLNNIFETKTEKRENEASSIYQKESEVLEEFDVAPLKTYFGLESFLSPQIRECLAIAERELNDGK